MYIKKENSPPSARVTSIIHSSRLFLSDLQRSLIDTRKSQASQWNLKAAEVSRDSFWLFPERVATEFKITLVCPGKLTVKAPKLSVEYQFEGEN